MAITFPRAMPLTGPARQRFEIQRVDFLSPEASGRLGAITAGFPLWSATWSLGTFGSARSDEWRAWVSAQRGPQRLFLGRDYARTFPLAYPGGFGGMVRAGTSTPFTGAATSWSQTIDGSGTPVLTLNGLPAAFAGGYGDYVDFRWGTFKRALVRALEPAVASGSGAISFSIEPAIPSLVPVDAVAHLDGPACLMRLTSDTDVGEIDRRLSVTGGKIVALQDLIA